MKLIKIVQAGIMLFSTYMLISCKKDFLEERPNSDLIIPHTFRDFQQLLDRDRIMNETPELGELSSTDYYLDPLFWQTLPPKERNSYTWQTDIYEGQGKIPDWNLPYQQIFSANIVLEGLDKMTAPEKTASEWNQLKGRALFVRGFALHNLAQVFAPVYDPVSASTDKGLPVRLSADINTPSQHATVKQVYDQITEDLTQAAQLLINTVDNTNPTRVSRPAAYGLLARVYLSMRSYEKAGLYADSSLQLYDSLLNYNGLNQTTTAPFSRNNIETLYMSYMNYNSRVLLFPYYSSVFIDSGLYKSYADTDLRKLLFFNLKPSGVLNGKFGYAGSLFATGFSGLATDEMYLIRAECSARADDALHAVTDLNTLLKKRYATNTFIENLPTSPEDALALVLAERRKELVFRGLRWSDLRRLNKEGHNITLRRNINGQEYTLPPNDSHYILPFPPDEESY